MHGYALCLGKGERKPETLWSPPQTPVSPLQIQKAGGQLEEAELAQTTQAGLPSHREAGWVAEEQGSRKDRGDQCIPTLTKSCPSPLC